MVIKNLMVFFFVFFLSSNVWSEDYVKGSGRFQAEDDDNVTFVKRELMASAVNDVITKELKAMKVDPELFWKNYEEKFSQHFVSIEDQLKKKYKVGLPEQTEQEKTEYPKQYRLKKLEEKRLFGGLNRILKRYKIDKVTRSPQYPQSRFLSMEALVDRKKLFEIYHDFVIGGGQREFEYLYITAHFQVPSDDWKLLGVQSRSDFVEAVGENWKKWFQDNQGIKVKFVRFTSDSEEERIKNYQKQMAVQSAFYDSSEQNHEFSNSLWLEINVKYDLLANKEEMRFKSFQIKAEVILFDLRLNTPLLFQDFPGEVKNYYGLNDNDLASQLASHTYRLPLPVLSQIPSKSNERSGNMIRKKMQIKNVGSVMDLMKVKDLITQKAVVIRAKAMEDSFSHEEASLTIEFTGDGELVNKTLLQLAGEKVGEKKITFPHSDNPFLVLLTKIN